MSKLSGLGAVVAVSALGMMFAIPSRAYPPLSTSFYSPTTPFVVCDTRDQISAIVAAMKAQKLDDKLMELGKIKNANNEPVCLVSVIGPVVFESSEHIGLVFYEGKAINMWVSRVSNANTEFYLLWGEGGESTSF